MASLGALLVAFTDNLATSVTSHCSHISESHHFPASPLPSHFNYRSRCWASNQRQAIFFPAVLEKVKEGEGKKYRKATAAAKKISGDAAVSSSFIRAGWHFHLSGRRENSAEGFSQGGGEERCSCRTATSHIGPRASRRTVATWLNILWLVHCECEGQKFCPITLHAGAAPLKKEDNNCFLQSFQMNLWNKSRWCGKCSIWRVGLYLNNNAFASTVRSDWLFRSGRKEDDAFEVFSSLWHLFSTTEAVGAYWTFLLPG